MPQLADMHTSCYWFRSAAEFVAKVRQLRTSSNLLLLQTEASSVALPEKEDSEGNLSSAGTFALFVHSLQMPWCFLHTVADLSHTSLAITN